MPRYIIEHTCRDGVKRYLIWSTIVDAPLTFGVSLEAIFDEWREEHGERGVDALKRSLDQRGFDKLEDVLACNRAGKNETRLSRQQIIDHYFEHSDGLIEPPLGEPSWGSN